MTIFDGNPFSSQKILYPFFLLSGYISGVVSLNLFVIESAFNLVPVISGFFVVPQYTPFSVIVAPPSEEIFPPKIAFVEVIFDAGVVVSVGTVVVVLTGGVG